MAKKKAKATKRSTKPAAKKKAAKVVRKPLKTKKKATRKVAGKVTRKPVAKRAAKKVARKVAKKAAPRPKVTRKPARAARPVAKVAKKITKKITKKVARKVAPKPKASTKATAPAALPVPTRLQRERKRLPEVELEEFSGEGSDERLLSSARTGHDELRAELRLHTEASPELTAGDVDAKWQDAYAVGDEAPGGDNMTPDQDRVDDIGKAIGVVYDDDEELMGGDEINARDEHRWELDPASKEDDEEL